MTNSKSIRIDKKKRFAYQQAGYAVACYDFRISVPAVSIEDNKSSHSQKTLFDGLLQTESDVTLEKSRIFMEKTVVAVFSAIESEKRYMKSKDFTIDRKLLKRIRHSIAPFTRSDRELTAYQNLLNIRAQDYIRDPLIWQKIKDVVNEIVNRKELSSQRIRAIIRESFTRSFEKWKTRQHKLKR